MFTKKTVNTVTNPIDPLHETERQLDVARILLERARLLLARCPRGCDSMFVGQDSIGYGKQARALAARIKVGVK